MKKLFIALIALCLSIPALAWGHCPPPPPCHGWGWGCGRGWGGFWAGAAVGALASRCVWGGGWYRPTVYARPAYYPVYTAPVVTTPVYTAPVVTAPVVYSAPVVTTPVVYTYW